MIGGSVLVSVVMFAANMSTNIGSTLGSVSSIGGVIYLIQIGCQVKVYGVKRWWHFGLGTGVEVHEAGKIEREAEGEVKKVVKDVEREVRHKDSDTV